MTLAHGVGSSADLPLPLDLVLQAGAAVVVLSFLISAWRRRSRAVAPDFSSLPLSWLRYPVLALALYVIVNAFAGPRHGNPAAHALFVWLWVGLIPISLLCGPVWRQVNPLRTLFTLLRLPRHGWRPLPPGSTPQAWPAAAFLLVFAVFELAVPHQGDPVAAGSFLLLYAGTQLFAAALRGEEWFARGDAFEVYSDLAGRLSPLVWRPWLSGLAAPLLPGTAAFVAVWWGSTVFDSASASPAWAGFVQRTGHAPILAAVALTLICGLVLLAVRWTAGRLDVTASLIPIAVGYTLAHYLSLLLVEGPRGVLLLVQQWGVLGGAAWTLIPIPSVVASLQVALILIGHVLGVVVAHDHALADSPDRSVLAVLADELPLMIFMIICTWAGLFLLFV
ncbi:hypothetical protein ACTI_81350 [Actinoplanes sp. OR16]|uniref:hypothetical protein n=1 Tax=Actinoplanes sp. OR16 TaxID=946334 RepID=UPI000F6DFB8B|nr:hypothetical protein [Actinoplanes sp. OR16]BBH71450.1 hypothetical protein ACTI_81350 [Actinoplanes sp. OR16]